MLASFPTVYLNSLRLSAAIAATENSAIQQMVAFVFVSIMLSLPASARHVRRCGSRSGSGKMSLPVLGRHLVKQLLLFVRLHQRIAGVDIVGVCFHPFLCV